MEIFGGVNVGLLYFDERVAGIASPSQNMHDITQRLPFELHVLRASMLIQIQIILRSAHLALRCRWCSSMSAALALCSWALRSCTMLSSSPSRCNRQAGHSHLTKTPAEDKPKAKRRYGREKRKWKSRCDGQRRRRVERMGRGRGRGRAEEVELKSLGLFFVSDMRCSSQCCLLGDRPASGRAGPPVGPRPACARS